MSDASYGFLGPGNAAQSASVNRANGCGTDLVQGVRSAGGPVPAVARSGHQSHYVQGVCK